MPSCLILELNANEVLIVAVLSFGGLIPVIDHLAYLFIELVLLMYFFPNRSCF